MFQATLVQEPMGVTAHLLATGLRVERAMGPVEQAHRVLAAAAVRVGSLEVRRVMVPLVMAPPVVVLLLVVRRAATREEAVPQEVPRVRWRRKAALLAAARRVVVLTRALA